MVWKRIASSQGCSCFGFQRCNPIAKVSCYNVFFGIMHFCCFEDTSRCPELQNPSGNRPRQGFQHNIFLEENGFEEDRIVARFLTCFGLQLCNPNPQILRAALCSSLGSFIFVVLGNLSHAQDSTTHQGSFQIRSKTRSVSEKAIWKCIA